MLRSFSSCFVGCLAEGQEGNSRNSQFDKTRSPSCTQFREAQPDDNVCQEECAVGLRTRPVAGQQRGNLPPECLEHVVRPGASLGSDDVSAERPSLHPVLNGRTRPELSSLLASGASFRLAGPTSSQGRTTTGASLESGSIGSLVHGGPDSNGARLSTACGGPASLKLSSFSEMLSNVADPFWVGQGAQGAVLKAHWRSGCPVAVKWLVSDAAVLPSAYLEALLARLMAHPFLVQTFEASICRLGEGWDRCERPSSASELTQERQQEQQRREWQQQQQQQQGQVQGRAHERGLAPKSNGGGHGTGRCGEQRLAMAHALRPVAPSDAAAALQAAAVIAAAPTSSQPTTAASNGAASRAAADGIPISGSGNLATSSGASDPARAHRSPMAPATPPRRAVPWARPDAMTEPAQRDSFEGTATGAAPTAAGAGPPRPVDCVGVLRQLGAAPGKYVVQIVAEWCDEGTLHGAIRRGLFRPGPGRSRTWALRALLRTAREVALGMCHLHSLGILHGDLKPGNVLLKSGRGDSRGFAAKVADFGLSRLLLGPAGAEGGEGFVATEEWGTVRYMAPEYLDSRLCKSSDVYSFGVLLWQMYTARTPFEGQLEAQVAVGVLLGTLALEWPEDMPPPLLRLGQACCRHDPAERPPFKEVAAAVAAMEAQVRDASALSKLPGRYTTSGHVGGAAAVALQRAATHGSVQLGRASTQGPVANGSLQLGRSLPYDGPLARSITQLPPETESERSSCGGVSVHACGSAPAAGCPASPAIAPPLHSGGARLLHGGRPISVSASCCSSPGDSQATGRHLRPPSGGGGLAGHLASHAPAAPAAAAAAAASGVAVARLRVQQPERSSCSGSNAGPAPALPSRGGGAGNLNRWGLVRSTSRLQHCTSYADAALSQSLLPLPPAPPPLSAELTTASSFPPLLVTPPGADPGCCFSARSTAGQAGAAGVTAPAPTPDEAPAVQRHGGPAAAARDESHRRLAAPGNTGARPRQEHPRSAGAWTDWSSLGA